MKIIKNQKPPSYQPDGILETYQPRMIDTVLHEHQNYIIHPTNLQIDEGVFFVPFFIYFYDGGIFK